MRKGTSVVRPEITAALPALSSSAIRLAVALGKYENAAGQSTPGQKRLMREAGIRSSVSLSKAFAELARIGLRRELPGPGRPTRYAWAPTSTPESVRNASPESPSSSDEDARPSSIQGAPPSSTSTPRPSSKTEPHRTHITQSLNSSPVPSQMTRPISSGPNGGEISKEVSGENGMHSEWTPELLHAVAVKFLMARPSSKFSEDVMAAIAPYRPSVATATILDVFGGRTVIRDPAAVIRHRLRERLPPSDSSYARAKEWLAVQARASPSSRDDASGEQRRSERTKAERVHELLRLSG